MVARKADGAQGQVCFVGAGPGDEGLLTLRAVDRLAHADVVIVDRDRAEVIASYCRSDAQVLDIGMDDAGLPLSREKRAKLVVASAAEGALVVRLMDGDPVPFTDLADEIAACRDAGIAFEVVPGVSTVSAVPAYAGVVLTPAGIQGVHIVHPYGTKIDWSLHIHDNTTVVILGMADDVVAAAASLMDAGRDPQTTLVVTMDGTTLQQRTVSCQLVTAGTQVPAAKLTGRLTAVVGSAATMHRESSWFETKPLFGWRVLVPRTKEQATSMVHSLAQHGARSDVVPTISVEPPRTPQQVDKAVQGLVNGRYSWVGFTSVHAVSAVRIKFAELGLDARAFAGIHVASVGGVTAAALREWGIEPDLVPRDAEDHTVAGLLQAWPAYDAEAHPMNRVFLPRADIATEALAAGLAEVGWEADDIVVYRTVRAAPPEQAIRDAIKSGRYDAVVFTSRSTVRNLVGIAGKPHPSTVIACIGPASAEAAREHGLRVDVLAPEPTITSLVAALAQYGQQLRTDAVEAGKQVLRPSQRRGNRRAAA